MNFKSAFFTSMASALFTVGGCTSSSSIKQQVHHTGGQEVIATYNGKGDRLRNKRTASGEIFNPEDMTAAHKSLPFGTSVKVTNPKNGKEVTVRINDRGPFRKNVDIDLSYAAARQLDIISAGTEKLILTQLN